MPMTLGCAGGPWVCADEARELIISPVHLSFGPRAVHAAPARPRHAAEETPTDPKSQRPRHPFRSPSPTLSSKKTGRRIALEFSLAISPTPADTTFPLHAITLASCLPIPTKVNRFRDPKRQSIDLLAHRACGPAPNPFNRQE